MTALAALALALVSPILGAALMLAFARPPGLRDVAHVVTAASLAAATLFIVTHTPAHPNVRVVLAHPLPHVDLAFAVEPLGALVGALIGGLGFLHAIHTVGMVRATADPAPARLMASISITYAAAIGAVYSANLLTYFVCYQLLTLTTFPLIAHAADEPARRAGRGHLAVLLTLSLGLILPAMIWTDALAGSLDFRPGGVLAGRVDVVTANILLVMFVLGLAMTSIPPGHRWLPVSSSAPYSALVPIQATAMLPVGLVGLIKVIFYIFGGALTQAAIAAQALTILAGVAMCVAAIVALSRQDLRARLAYSCMTQALAAELGALLLGPSGALPQGGFAATLQILALAGAGATLMMAAGNVFAATGRRDGSDMSGLGRAMPWTFGGFAIGAASMIGMPPFAGAWAKLWLITAGSDAGMLWASVLVAAGAVLTFAHLAPLAAGALAGRRPADPFKNPDGASIVLVAPVVLSAAATLGLLLIADWLVRFLGPLWGAS